MKHIDEDHLEQFASNPGDFSNDQRIQIDDHLERCRHCRVIYKYFFDFYKEYEKYSSERSPVVDEFVDALYSVIPISVYNVQKQRKVQPQMTVLAAMTAAQGSDRFRLVATLASEEQKALIRILGDVESNKIKMYVITEDPGKRSHAVISFPDISTDFVTNNKGRLEVDFPVTDWKAQRGFLRFMLGEITVPVGQLKTSTIDAPVQLTSGFYNLSTYYSKGILNITTQRNKIRYPDIKMVVVTNGNEDTFLIYLNEGVGSCYFPLLSDTITLRLYS